MPRASRDGVSIFYEREGEGDPVVLIQGLSFGRWMWRWQREALRGEYEVIAPDNRGTGRSDDGLSRVVTGLPGRLRTPVIFKLAGYSVAGLAADLEAVLADAGLHGVHLVGASLGGMVAQRYAIEYGRARTLSLLCTTPGGPDAVPIPTETAEAIYDVPRGVSERERLRRRMRPAFGERFTNRNPHLMDRIVEWRLEQDAEEPARTAQAAAGAGFEAGEGLERLGVPTLVVHGTDDRVVPVGNAHLLTELLPNARLEIVEGGSHCLFVEHADRVNVALLEFLDDHAG